MSGNAQVKKKDLQRISAVVQEFQAKLLQDVDAAKLRDALNLALLQMQTYWKILKKKQDRGKGDKFSWPWYDLRNPEANKPQYLANSLYGAGVQKQKLSELFELLSIGEGEGCQKYMESNGYNGETDVLGRSPLHYCAGVSELEHYIKLFVNKGCNVNTQAHDGSTALHRAVINENPVVTDDLLQMKADASVRDSEGRSAAHWAVEAENTACLELLVRHSADLNIPDNEAETPIMWAAKRGRVGALRVLLSSPVGPKLAATTDGKSQSLLHLGVNHIEVVELFLNSDSVLERDKHGRNVLHHAAILGVLDVCKFIESRFDLVTLLKPDHEGRTPVHHAVNHAHSGVTNFLLERGGSTNSVDKQGLTPHSIAQIKQLHYCSIVISAYHQGDDHEAKSTGIHRPPAPKNASFRSDLQNAPSPPSAPLKPTASFNQHPNDRRVVILTSSNGSSLSKSTPAPRLKMQAPANLSTITPGLLRHSSHQISNISQKPGKLREISEIRDKITGRCDQAPIFPQRPPSSRGKRNKRPSSPIPINNNTAKEGAPLPWKLNIIPPKPPPKRDDQMNGHADAEQEDVPERPRTARGSNPEPLSRGSNHEPLSRGSNPEPLSRGSNPEPLSRVSNHEPISREDSGILQPEKSHHNMHEELKDTKMTPRYSKVEQIQPRKGESLVIEQTVELMHSLPESGSLRGSSLLGPMPTLPGRQNLPPDPNPWYKKKLCPVTPNKMDILQPDSPDVEDGN